METGGAQDRDAPCECRDLWGQPWRGKGTQVVSAACPVHGDDREVALDREAGSVDGSWLLTLAAVQPGNSATIPIVQLPDGATEPQWWAGEQTLTLVWADGRRDVWSWANLLSASYTPPVRAASRPVSPFPPEASTTYALWFRTPSRAWQAWAGEQTTPGDAESFRDACLRRFPDATAVVVEKITSRRGYRG